MRSGVWDDPGEGNNARVISREPVLVGESRVVAAPPDRVFAELSDAWSFPTWVVGASHIRDVDAHWPRPGARLHHQVGGWPFAIKDSTEVIECETPTRLRLLARAWPVGEAEVDIRVEPAGDGSLVTMLETPVSGPGHWLDNPVQRLVLRRRNREALARLAIRAEKRPDPRGGAGWRQPQER